VNSPDSNKYKILFEKSADAMLIIEDEMFVDCNQATLNMLGYTKREAFFSAHPSALSPELQPDGRFSFEKANEMIAIAIEQGGNRFEWIHTRANGENFPVEVLLTSIPFENRTLLHVVWRDITKRTLAENKIHQLAYTDPNTGMPNELAFLEKLHEGTDQDRQGFVAFIELSGLGDIIGTFGIEALELIVYEFGSRLFNQMNDLSIVAKVGQRSFRVAYMTDNTDKQDLKDIATRIFQIATQSFELMGSEVFIIVHMGVSFIDVEKSTANSILSDVEIARYEAMESIASSMVYFNSSIKERLARRTMVVSWLHSAIRDNAFELFFQPQVNLKTNTIVGCEALIRWHRSPGEWITPGEFIPIAEKAGLIEEITKWTVDEACRTAISWDTNQKLKVRVGVNISALELASPNFIKYVLEFIVKAKLPPEFLEIEITETALMKDPAIASKNLTKLRKMGASIAIDDFGTGQASLAYLKSFPIDRLKIDQSFVLGSLTNKTDREIIVSVVKLAHSLDIEVIAEGAEEKEHIDLLTSLGCDEVQGYFIAKPMPTDQFVKFVQEYS